MDDCFVKLIVHTTACMLLPLKSNCGLVFIYKQLGGGIDFLYEKFRIYSFMQYYYFYYQSLKFRFNEIIFLCNKMRQIIVGELLQIFGHVYEAGCKHYVDNFIDKAFFKKYL